MGAALNWIALENSDGTVVLERLGLQPCGTATDEINSDYACAVLPNGWFLLVSGRSRLKLEEMLPVVSAGGGFALGGQVEEHVMFSQILGYRDGERAWAVVHDPDVEHYGVTTSGTLPAVFAEIYADLAEQQAAGAGEQVDYIFDAPVRLGERLCGYAHDAVGPLRVWTVLEARDGRQAPRPELRLADRLEREIVPELEALGWARLAEPIMGGLELERVFDGDRQYILIEWQDHPRLIRVDYRFAILEGPASGSPIRIDGRVFTPPPPLWRNLGRWLLRLGAPRSYDSRVAEAAARARDELLAIHHFVSGGPRDPRLYTTTYKTADLQAPPPT